MRSMRKTAWLCILAVLGFLLLIPTEQAAAATFCSEPDVNIDVTTSKPIYSTTENINITIHYTIRWVHSKDAYPIMFARPRLTVEIDGTEITKDDCVSWVEEHEEYTRPVTFPQLHPTILPSNIYPITPPPTTDTQLYETVFECYVYIEYPSMTVGSHTVSATVIVLWGDGTYTDSDEVTFFVIGAPITPGIPSIPWNP